MEIAENIHSNNSQIMKILYEFKFHCLKQIKTEDERTISAVIQFIKQFLVLEDFYTNANNCLDDTLDFILTHIHFLIKQAGSRLLSKFVLLLADLFYGMQEIVKQNKNIHPVDFLRVFNLLETLIESDKIIELKLVGAITIIPLLGMMVIDNHTLIQFMPLVYNVMYLFVEQEQILELARLFTAILRYPINDMLYVRMKLLIEEKVLTYLIQNKAVDNESILTILHLLKVYYKEYALVNDPEDSSIINSFKTLLPYVSLYMQQVDFRLSAEQLLYMVVYHLHYINFNKSNYKETMDEIQRLPYDLHEWPLQNSGIFFVIAYLDISVNDETLWNCQDILEAMNRLLSPVSILEQPILKCLLDLYPIILQDKVISDTTNTGKALINILSTRRTFPELLTYNKAQIKWLLKNTDSRFKTSVLIAWLKFQNNDDEIVKILEECNMGYVLVEFLVQHSDVPLAARISQLIPLLKKNIRLNNAILRAMPVLCNRPSIISRLVHIQPDISNEPDIAMNTMCAVSVSMTFFTDDTAIQSACLYLQDSIRALGLQRNILEAFCKFSACIRFLSIKACIKNDNTVVAILGLLIQLIHIQVINKVQTITNPVEIEFSKVLKSENSERLSHGLKLLRILLNHKQQNLLIKVNHTCISNVYQQTHTLTKNDTASDAFEVLLLLSCIQPKLMFSLATPLCIQLVCHRGLNPEHYRSFMNFLTSWLKQVCTHWYITLPVGDLRYFVQKFLKNDIQFPLVMTELKKYENRVLHQDQL